MTLRGREDSTSLAMARAGLVTLRRWGHACQLAGDLVISHRIAGPRCTPFRCGTSERHFDMEPTTPGNTPVAGASQVRREPIECRKSGHLFFRASVDIWASVELST